MRYVGMIALLALAACAEQGKDYDAMAKCSGLGYEKGSTEYDQCLKDERAQKLLQQQRREFEQMKQEDRDWKMRRY